MAGNIGTTFKNFTKVFKSGSNIASQGTRLGLLTSLLCKVRLRGMSAARRICCALLTGVKMFFNICLL